MIVKLLGILDLLAAITLSLYGFGFIGWHIALWLVLYLVFKGIALGGLAGVLDIAVGILTILAFIGLPWTLALVLSILWLLQKGLFSLV